VIRVLRVLEYEYATGEEFARDAQNWTRSVSVRHGVSRNGPVRFTMQSNVVSITATKGEVVPEVPTALHVSDDFPFAGQS
jgi:hypothetical protein